MPKVSRPVIYVSLFAVAVAAFVLTSEDESAPSAATTRTRRAPAPKSVAGFTEEDYAAKYPALNESSRNAFMPLVKRTEPSTLVGQPFVEGNAIPEDLAGGPSWIYTGMAEVNGVKHGLVENSATGDGEFIKPGQRWKRATVLTVTPDTLTLMGSDGVVRRMRTLDDPTAMPSNRNPGLQPVNPGLTGPIGQPNLQVRPTAGNFGTEPNELDNGADDAN